MTRLRSLSTTNSHHIKLVTLACGSINCTCNNYSNKNCNNPGFSWSNQLNSSILITKSDYYFNKNIHSTTSYQVCLDLTLIGDCQSTLQFLWFEAVLKLRTRYKGNMLICQILYYGLFQCLAQLDYVTNHLSHGQKDIILTIESSNNLQLNLPITDQLDVNLDFLKKKSRLNLLYSIQKTFVSGEIFPTRSHKFIKTLITVLH